MRVLVTGAGGFVGRHLVRELSRHGHECIAVDKHYASPVDEAIDTLTGDLLDAEFLRQTVEEMSPDGCAHLGGIAFVPAGSENPGLMLEINTAGTINVLDAFRDRAPEARILTVTTAQVYGLQARETTIPEDAPLAPIGMYAVSKSAADLATLAYSGHYGMTTMTARPNNHTGPGQSPQFVIPSFVRQAIAISRGQRESRLEVGNLDCRRDFTDVRDVARAYRLLLEKGEAGLAYNISSGQQVRIRDILDQICAMAGISPEITVDPDKFRPTNSSPNLSTDRIERRTDWKPGIPLDQTLADMLKEV